MNFFISIFCLVALALPSLTLPFEPANQDIQSRQPFTDMINIEGYDISAVVQFLKLTMFLGVKIQIRLGG